MSFLKITDPAKRDFIVQEFLKTKKNIQQDFLTERIGDASLQQELTKLYKPITTAQTRTQKALQENLGAMKALPASLATSISTSLKSITLPQYPSIEVFEDAPEAPSVIQLGELATKYMQDYASNRKITDTIFGIKSENGSFYIGNKPIKINGDDITVDGFVYKGTPGLWELLTMKEPNDSVFDGSDLSTYGEILVRTNAMSQPTNPNKPRASKSKKYNQIIEPIWRRRNSIAQGITGEGMSTIVIPQDPNALVEMLKLRLASFEAGNTGVRNEIVSICDELLRQGQINREDYKKLINIKC